MRFERWAVTSQIGQRAGEENGGVPSLLLVLLALLTVGLGWLGLISVLGTNHPFEATVGSSMLPTLETGDLVILRGVAPRDIRRGDIVAVHPSAEDQTKYNYPDTVMHRVERVTFDKKTVMVYTRGDNESASDPFSVPASAVEGRLAYSIPNAGWILLYLRSKQGLIAVGGLLILYVVYSATKWISDDEPDEESASPTGFTELASAIAEYGEHLRSHTRVVQELGGTTAELHLAARTQNEVLDNLKQVLMSERGLFGGEHVPSESGPAISPPRPVAQPAPDDQLRPLVLRAHGSTWSKDSRTSEEDLAIALSRVVIRGRRAAGPVIRADLDLRQLASYRLTGEPSLTIQPAPSVREAALAVATLLLGAQHESAPPEPPVDVGAAAVLTTLSGARWR